MVTPLDFVFLSVIVAAIVFLYPYLAIARIWFYSKQQTRILKDIYDSLTKIESHTFSAPPGDG